ncbi:16S rRNA (uracil(1498)-N(3))-methyltransferase [Georgenia alba]|uniref:Ribosomal RNA small subunit methyltransferase E n=1 Tax=Georgenia alba TaxID=2233858 RepID=A0ABW2Q906_9MICO
MTRPVFHAEAAVLGAARPGEDITLRGDEARHAATVRRLRPGEEVDVVDGAGRRVTGTVVAAERDGLTVSVTAVVDEPRPAPRLVLVQALAKGGRDEQAVEAATELGVDAVVPWQADRSVSVWTGKPERAAKGRRRWEAVTTAAGKQSRRASFPAVRDLVTTAGLRTAVAGTVAGGGTVLVLHEAATTSLTTVALPQREADTEVVVVVGPEGGITDEELAALGDAGAQVVRAGPHVMRSSTAGPAALGVLASRTGRWE